MRIVGRLAFLTTAAPAILLSLTLAGCQGETEAPFEPPPVVVTPDDTAPPGTLPGTEPPPATIEPTPPPADAIAVLELDALDIWAQPLPSTATLVLKRYGQPVATSGFPLAATPLEAGDYHVTLSAPEHDTLDLDFTYDGSNRADALKISRPANMKHGVSIVRGLRQISAGHEVPVYTLYLGLHHRWFSSEGRPARRANAIQLLMDSEEAWRSVHSALTAAQRQVLISTWWWESNFELVRPANHTDLTTIERNRNTIMGVLDASPATKRVLVGQFLGQDGLLSSLTTDAPLRAHGAAANDHFEFMGQANETAGTFDFVADAIKFGDRVRARVPGTAMKPFDPEAVIASTIPGHHVDLTAWPVGVTIEHASFHQKFMAVDDDLAFVGGMNLRRVDWDSSAHKIFEPRRMLFDATRDDRIAVANKENEPDNGPRKDYMLRIQGPAAEDVADVFKRRWDVARAEGADYSANSAAFTTRAGAAQPTGSQVQITTTLPEPYWEHSIAETWLNAINNAERYIYIEDQYFRVPMLVEAIVRRMQQVPALRLIVITKPVSEWTDPGCAWTHITHGQLKTLFPTRYLMLQLRAFDYHVTWGFDETDAVFADMDVHSKMLIVDDKFMSVGSANKNNRGMIYEAEMNAAVLDPLWVRDQRRRILANILPAGTVATDDAPSFFRQLSDAARYNDTVRSAWDAEGDDIDLDGDPLPTRYQPKGFLYGLDFRNLSDCLFESIGPDMV